jgi:nucleic acid-binding protein
MLKGKMMFYHVLVENDKKDKDGENIQYYQLDIDDREKVLEKFVVQYLKGQTLRVDGYSINNACRFIVTQSESSLEEIIKQRKAMREFLKKWNENRFPRKPESPNISSEESDSIKEILKEILLDKRYVVDITDKLLEEAQNLLDTTAELGNKIPATYSNHKVFIVHGRDHNLLTQVENVLMKLGLDPIVLQEQANNGKTIIEKIEECTDVGFGIVLYTPCDEGRLKSEGGELKPRARQNVVLEHGYLMAKLGRERVCCLVSDDVEFPSDIQGVVYTSAKNVGQWKYEIAKELKAAGFSIDTSKL